MSGIADAMVDLARALLQEPPCCLLHFTAYLARPPRGEAHRFLERLAARKARAHFYKIKVFGMNSISPTPPTAVSSRERAPSQ